MEKDADQQSSRSEVDAQQIASMRDEMIRFATLQLRDAVLAEDIVHDAINAALSSDKFEGRASLKSWVYQILRNKIIDVFRQRSRHVTESFTENDNVDEQFNGQFNEQGYWKKDQQPSNWGRPEITLANDQFWVIFEICLNRLPENTARVFMMREHLGLEISEICKELNLSGSNAWVIMHRARSQLRQCLEINFVKGRLHNDEL